MKQTEAQKRASKKYYLSHYEYYKEKSKENAKRMRRERREYKARIEDALGYIKENQDNVNGALYLQLWQVNELREMLGDK